MANERLRGAILSAELSPDDLAFRIGVDPKTVQRWVSKDRVPHRRHRQTAAELLDATELYLWPTLADDPATVSASHAELVEFFPSRSAVPEHLWLSMLQNCTESFDLLVYAGQHVPEHLGAIPRFERLAEAGARVRVLMGDPTADAIALRGAEEGQGDGMASRIHISMSYYQPLRGRTGFELRLHDTTLYASILRSDTSMLVNTHVYGSPASQSPVMYLRRVPGGRVFDHYMASFEKVWDQAEPTEGF